MLFNSIDFALFLPIVFALYWVIGSERLKIQNILLLVASYYFYGCWDWRFLGLIIFSSFIDYSIGNALSKTENLNERKLLLFLSLFVNLGFLGFFKYYNFFLDSFTTVFTFFGQSFEPSRLNIILPVGISFYTFQTLSYTIDVYRKKLEPSRNIISFFAFVSFFPQLVAGPIERATKLLPQFYEKRSFKQNLAIDGMRQILWGLFKKMVIADSCAEYVNSMFQWYEYQSASTLLVAAILFAFQIYCDFSGYSDIAIGTSRLFGFKLMKNFNFPYFSRDIGEFWRRWHISLSTWFRDYLYIPLGGSRGGNGMRVRNTFIIFIVSGFWHGANWTFLFWGFLNALYFIPLLLLGKNRSNLDTVAAGRIFPSMKEIIQIMSTFLLTVFAWIFFRAESITKALLYIGKLFDSSIFSIPKDFKLSLLLLIMFFMIIEWLQREKEHGLENLELKMSKSARWIFYVFLIFLIYIFEGEQANFIYFQF